MIGRHTVAEDSQRTGFPDVLCRCRFQRESIGRAAAFEERRVLDVSAFRIPGKDLARGCRDFVPLGVACGITGIGRFEHFRFQGFFEKGVDLFGGRPEIFQINGFSVFICSDGLGSDIDIHTAGQRERDYQRR